MRKRAHRRFKEDAGELDEVSESAETSLLQPATATGLHRAAHVISDGEEEDGGAAYAAGDGNSGWARQRHQPALQRERRARPAAVTAKEKDGHAYTGQPEEEDDGPTSESDSDFAPEEARRGAWLSKNAAGGSAGLEREKTKQEAVCTSPQYKGKERRAKSPAATASQPAQPAEDHAGLQEHAARGQS